MLYLVARITSGLSRAAQTTPQISAISGLHDLPSSMHLTNFVSQSVLQRQLAMSRHLVRQAPHGKNRRALANARGAHRQAPFR
jgi:hypothetical protein